MIKRKTLFLFLLTLVVSLAVTITAAAQEPVPTPPPAGGPSDNDVNTIAKKLYCPVCPNTPLDVCETTACKDWRSQIREQLASGWSEKQVLDYFVVQYGERVLAEPERRGFTSLVWMLPVLIVVLGLVIVWLVLRGWRKSARPYAVAQPATQSETRIPRQILDKIEAEIREID